MITEKSHSIWKKNYCLDWKVTFFSFLFENPAERSAYLSQSEALWPYIINFYVSNGILWTQLYAQLNRFRVAREVSTKKNSTFWRFQLANKIRRLHTSGFLSFWVTMRQWSCIWKLVSFKLTTATTNPDVII